MTISRKVLELSADLSEPALDSFLSSGFLRDIPILGSAIKLADLVRSISDRVFLTKIQRFMGALDTVRDREAEDFGSVILWDEETARRTGEVMLLSIDAMNDLEKAPILAYIFSAYCRNEIGFGTLRRLNAAVNLAMVEDLWALADQRPDNRWDEDSHGHRLQALHALRITGLTALSDAAFQLTGRRSFIGTEVSALGQTLVDILRSSPQAMNT